VKTKTFIFEFQLVSSGCEMNTLPIGLGCLLDPWVEVPLDGFVGKNELSGSIAGWLVDYITYTFIMTSYRNTCFTLS